MAGNLAEYVLIDYKGDTKLGKNVDYNGAPAGYTKMPSENISYVSKHDNQTLWDNNAYKIATGTSSAERTVWYGDSYNPFVFYCQKAFLLTLPQKYMNIFLYFF